MRNPARIISYGCTSSAGRGVDRYWNALVSGETRDDFRWPWEAGESVRDRLAHELGLAWRETLGKISASRRTSLDSSRLGVVLAMTKGCVDDFIWDQGSEHDPITPVLDQFVRRSEIHVTRSICVSNACASALSALYLAQSWIDSGIVDYALVLAADHSGKFVNRGFASLHALTATTPRPFSADRDGLAIGDAAAAILLAATDYPAEAPALYLEGVGIDSSGFAVTRPSRESLMRAYAMAAVSDSAPDLIIAHGTGTSANDQAEDEAFSAIFGEKKIPITGTKWCIGHTLGASGAMDVIAAGEAIARKRTFGIATTAVVDPSFKGDYLTQTREIPVSRVLIASLGFGSTHAVAQLSREFSK